MDRDTVQPHHAEQPSVKQADKAGTPAQAKRDSLSGALAAALLTPLPEGPLQRPTPMTKPTGKVSSLLAWLQPFFRCLTKSAVESVVALQWPVRGISVSQTPNSQTNLHPSDELERL